MVKPHHNPSLQQVYDTSFFETYWQKRALLLRNAFKDFQPLLSRDELFALAADPEVESRLVIKKTATWEVRYGPFSLATLQRLPKKNWTILIQGVNLHHDGADKLLRQFSFIPYTRLDDLMISYATPGGGVGPHFDSYDVFLLQAHGTRRWEISAQSQLNLIPNLPLKILQDFHPEQAWEVNAGDLLYLPPRYAHNGTAITECMTYSIGFRAPSYQELGDAFLHYLGDKLQIPGQYQDPDLLPTSSPAAVNQSLKNQVAKILQSIRWTDNEIDHFIGSYFSEPKSTLVFTPPLNPVSFKKFQFHLQKNAQNGLLLDRKTQLLYDEIALYCNGEVTSTITFPASSLKWLRSLANQRINHNCPPDQETQTLCYEWYLAGYLHLSIPSDNPNP